MRTPTWTASIVALACHLAACSDDPPLGTAAAPVWTNGDFESDPVGAAPTGWTIATKLNPAITDTRPAVQTLASLNLGNGGQLMTKVVGGAPESQTDPDLGTLGTLRFPKYGQRATRINYGDRSALGDNKNANTMTQTMTVGLGDVDPVDDKVHVRFAVAPILENPAHAYTQQPYYYVRLRNLSTGVALYEDFNASGQPGVPWKDFVDPAGEAAQYTDWQLVDVAPGNVALAVGDQVELTIVAAGCSQGGHWGRVYVDAVGSGVPGLYAWSTGPQQANAGTDIVYHLHYKNGGTTTTSGTRLDFVTPPGTNFRAVSLGAACTAPAVGAAGTVSCPLGTLANGSVGELEVTVRVPPATPAGTVILSGNYTIYATGVSALVGPKVFTTVTSGAAFADLGVTIGNGVPALAWGAPTTYTIDVTNAGPLPVAVATVTDTMPAELAGATWTCVASGGGICAAAGAGDIVDASAALPVGAALRYTVTGAIVAGSGSGVIRHAVTVAAGAGISDPDTSDNTALDRDDLGTLRTLTVTKLGDAAVGTVSSVPSSIGCGAGCTAAAAPFLDGSHVVLTAAPAAGAVFHGWGGACAGTAPSCTITITGDLTVTASFGGTPAALHRIGGDGQTATVGAGFAVPLTVEVVDAAGQPVPGVVVGFAAPGSGATATVAATATTDASGRASVTATAGATGGSYTVTATVAGLAPVGFALTNRGLPASIAAVSGAGSATVASPFDAALVAVVRDAGGLPVPGAVVDFTAPASGASAELAATSATTDAAGEVTITASAGTVAGAYAVTARVAGVAVAASFARVNLAGPAAVIAPISGSGQRAVVATAFAAPLIAQVRDAYDNPVADATVTFSAPAAGASATPSAAVVQSDATGRAAITATAGSIVGTYQLRAAIAAGSAGFSLGNDPGAPAHLALVGGGDQATAVTTGFADPIVVELTDAFANPIPRVAVGVVVPTSGATAAVTAPAVTDDGGRIAATAIAGDRAGGYAVTFTVGAVTVGAALTNLAGPPAAIAIVGGDHQHATIEAAFADPLAVEVSDAHGNPIAAAAVGFAAPASGPRATVGAPPLTDDSGRTAVTATAGAVAGRYAVTATVAGLAPIGFVLDNDPGPAATLAVAAGDGQDTVVARPFAAPLVVIARDRAGNPAPGAAITFTAAGAPACATVSGPPPITDADGEAAITATAGELAGPCEVTADVAADPDIAPARFALTSRADLPSQARAAATTTPQATTVRQPFVVPLAVEVADRFGNPTPGVTVTYQATVGDVTATLSAATAVTDERGATFVSALASASAGDHLVAAVIGDGPLAVEFQLSNLAGAPAQLAIAGGAAQAAEVDTDFASPLVVQVVDADHNPVPGAIVELTTAAGPVSAIVTPAAVVTDHAGRAAVRAHAGTGRGDHVVVAVVAGAAAPVGFALTNTAGPPAAIIAAPTATPQRAEVTTAYAPLAVRVEDRFGNSVPAVAIHYQAPAQGPTAILAAEVATSDGDGAGQVALIAGTEAGPLEVLASVAGVATPARFALTNLPGPAHAVTAEAGGDQITTVATSFDAPLRARVTDGFGNPVGGAEVTFVAPTSGAGAVVATVTVVTDDAGRAETELVAGTIAGGYQVLAHGEQGATPAAFSLRNTPAAPATVTAAPGSTPQRAEVLRGFDRPLLVIVADRFGNRVPDVVVDLVAPREPGANLSAATATTDGSGEAGVFAVADRAAGDYQVEATVAGLAPVTFALTNAAAAPDLLLVAAGDGQHALATTRFAAPLVLRVLDALGNPVPDVPVTVTLPATGPGATVIDAAGRSDAAGEVALTLAAAAVPGRFEVVARADRAARPTIATLTVDAIPTAVIARARPRVAVDQPVTIAIAIAAPVGTAAGVVEVVDAADRVLATTTLTAGAGSVAVPVATVGPRTWFVRYPAQGAYAAGRSPAIAVEILDDSGSLSGSGGCQLGGGQAGWLATVLVAATLLGRRRRRLAAAGALIGLLAVGARPAAAQDVEARAIGRFHAAAADSDWFATDSLTFGGHREVTLAMTWDHAWRPLVAYDGAGMARAVIVADSSVVQVGASVTILDRVRLAGTAPMAVYQDGSDGTFNGMALDGPTFAFGDVHLAADVRLSAARTAAVRLAVGVGVTLPTGSRHHYMSDGEAAVEPRAMIASSRGRFEVAGSVGASIHRRTTLARLSFGSELRYGASAGAWLFGRRLLVGPEVIGALPLVADSASGHPLELGVGGHVALRRQLRLGLGATTGVINAVGTPERRLFVSLGWAP